MTTIVSRPVYTFVGGQAVFIGNLDEIIEGIAETRYLAEGALRAAYTTLGTWAADAAQANLDWPTMTANQKDAATRETIRRLGLFFDRFRDLLLLDGRS